jgi:hypothetical protein
MPHHHKWQSRIKAVEREYVAMRHGLAARCGIPDTQRDNVHSVREYRNSLAHERDDEPETILIAAARHFLCHYFSFLPQQW